MENLSYTENIAEVYANDIAKRINLKNLSYSILCLLLSAATVTIPSLTEELPPSVNIFLFTLGIAGIVCSLTAILLSNRRCVFKPTGSPVRIITRYIDSKSAAAITALLEKNYGDAFPDAQPNTSNARLNVWRSKDEKFAAVQLSLYRPHEFYTVTPIVRVPWTELKPLAEVGEKL